MTKRKAIQKRIDNIQNDLNEIRTIEQQLDAVGLTKASAKLDLVIESIYIELKELDALNEC